MIIKIITAFLLFSAFTHHVVSLLDAIGGKGYVQLAAQPVGSCVVIQCETFRIHGFKCVRTWINNGNQSDVYYLKTIDSKTLDLHNATDSPTGHILEVISLRGVVKLILKEKDGKLINSGCLTMTRQPSDEDKEDLPKLCKKDGMKVVDNSNCK